MGSATTTKMSHQVPHQHAMGLPTQGGGNKDSTKDSGKWGSGMTVNVEETMTYNGHHFMREPHMCCDSAKLMLCPCCPFFKYTSPNESFVFSNSCLCCCQDWKVEQLTKGSNGEMQERGTGKKMGGTVGPGCCENGCMYLCCPFFLCSGNAILQNMYHHADGHEKNIHTIRQQFACCWPCGRCCAPCGMCSRGCSDCCNYCQDKNYVLTTEKIYPAEDQMSREVDCADTDHVGRIIMADRIGCIGCCPFRTPVKYSTIINEAGHLDNEMAAVDGIILMLWKGAPVPCFCCTFPPVNQPTGISCLDIGRQVESDYMTMDQMMTLTASCDPLILSQALDAKFGGRPTAIGNKGSVNQA